MWTKVLALLLCLQAAHAGWFGGSDDSDGPVTCGSVVKLLNSNYKVRLHSHEVKYGSGSGQQSVTGMKDSDDVNSHWQILSGHDGACERGAPIKCGDTIRLMHMTTRCLLHSHHFTAPLSRGNQEVSCFGTDGAGDTGDNWKVICGGDVWTEDEEVKFKHVDTAQYLSISGQVYSRPINGQMEVCATSSSGYSANWRVAEGVYMSSSKEEQPVAKDEF
uniref:Stromal cell-derived factor 2 n=1 Tax=Steinernema glaseri TaxID=37863 RepID=A0A1I7ZN13_9BILA